MMKRAELPATARLHQWWQPKASNLLAILYLVMMLTALPFRESLYLFFPSVLTILGIGSFGHFINDWYDRETDQRVNKFNRLASLPVTSRLGLFATSLVLALLPWLILPANRFSLMLLLLELVLLLIYAMPPVRLKENKLGAILADGAYAYAIPSVLAAYTFFLASQQHIPVIFLLVLFFWQWMYGIRHYLNHLALDRLNDLEAGSTTLATQKGNSYIHHLISKVVVPIEVLLFVGLIGIVYQQHSLFVYGTAIVATLLYVVPLVQWIARNGPIVGYRFTTNTLDYFYQHAWAYIPLFFLVIQDRFYLLLVVLHWVLFHLAMFKPIRLRRWFADWVYRLYYFKPTYFLFYPIIYLKRKMFPGDTSWQPTNLEQEHRDNIRRSSLTEKTTISIAVINKNKSKYTETFITEMVLRLKYKVYFLYGDELPLYDDDGKHFLTQFAGWRQFLSLLEVWFSFEKGYFLKQSIANYLQAKKIQLVLAEFGSSGVCIRGITESLGIPLIVHFHGYDIYDKRQLRRYEKEYSQLFTSATKLLAVSQHMLARLAWMGAPEEKLVHLPAYMRLELFPYQLHLQDPPCFIAVGRFAESKSPHLTILAFNEVVKIIPGARLVMVGRDGGGELFESCLILVRALKLENSIIFKDVLSHAEVAIEMQAASIFVQHSVITPENGDMEGKPVAIMEAMACGLPVIATKIPGIEELIVSGMDGLLVPAFDYKAMAEAMLQIAGDPGLAEKLGRNASNKIHGHPLISRHIAVLENLIDSCIV